MNAPTRPPLLVRLLPRRVVSRMVGALAALPLPPFLRRPLYGLYVRRYGVSEAEMDRPLRGYRSFRAFFTRRLASGARRLADDPRAIVSPADGRTAAAGVIESTTLVQAKGLDYDVGELLGDPQAAAAYVGGTYHVVYLAPGDYHRFHFPLDLEVDLVRHLPGDLWPVNERAVATVPRLFARNERVVVEGRTPAGGRVAFVAVGALDVGSIHLAFHDVATNRPFRRRPRTWRAPPGQPLHMARRGDELGWFALGSTTVLLVSAAAGRLDPPPAGSALRMGEPIGRVDASPSGRAPR